MQLHPQVTLGRRYRVHRRIGAGGMAEVWEAEHLSLGQRVAVKQLLPHAAQTPELVSRFRREAELLGRMRSDHVARVLDFLDESPYGPLLVMEFVEGESLAAVVRARRLQVEEAIDIGLDVLRAVRELHASEIVHRDLKPANVLLERSATGRRRALLIDLGMARRCGKNGGRPSSEEIADSDCEITRSDVALGTMEYMAPEQITNARLAGFAADVYAVGAMLYRAVAGRHVFDDLRGADLARAKLVGEAPALAIGREDEVATRFAALIAAMLRRSPGERPATAAAALSELVALRAVARHRARPVTSASTATLEMCRSTTRTAIARKPRLKASSVEASEVKHEHRFCIAGAAALAVLALLTSGAALATAVAVRASPQACASPAPNAAALTTATVDLPFVHIPKAQVALRQVATTIDLPDVPDERVEGCSDARLDAPPTKPAASGRKARVAPASDAEAWSGFPGHP